MKRLLSIFLAGVALAMNLRADDLPSSFLRTYSLDERVGYSIPVALHRGMTTLVFPEPPRNFAASRIAFIEPGQTVPDFSKDDRVDFVLLAHRGSTTCSIEALRPDSQDTLSVFLGDKVYQLFLRADEDQPLLTVEFKYRPDVGNNQVAAVSPIIVGTTRNITDRKRAEEKLAQAQRELSDRATHLDALVQERTQKLVESIGELESFSYSIPHPFRSLAPTVRHGDRCPPAVGNEAKISQANSLTDEKRVATR